MATQLYVYKGDTASVDGVVHQNFMDTLDDKIAKLEAAQNNENTFAENAPETPEITTGLNN